MNNSSFGARLRAAAFAKAPIVPATAVLLFLSAAAGAAWLPPQTRRAVAAHLPTINLAKIALPSIALPQPNLSGFKFENLAYNPANNRARLTLATQVGKPTLVVNSTADAPDAIPGDGACQSSSESGAVCTLRAAIMEANADGGGTINFNIPGAGVQTIKPATQLPNITVCVVIDGTTQPGSSANTLAVGDNAKILVEINFAGVAAGSVGLSLAAGSDGSTLKGLAINRVANGAGVAIVNTSRNTISGCFIGTDTTGTLARGNFFNGIGMAISSSNVIGGPSPAARNIISANGLVNSNPGVFVVLGGANNTIQNNYIGTDSSGTKALGNGGSAIQLLSAASDATATNSNTITGNLISGNGLPGIEIDGPKASANSVQSNKIGTQANGSSALPNSSDGILLAGAANTSIGANTIAFNMGNGVAVTGNAATGNRINGNSIFSNTKLGIDLGNDGVTPNDFGQQDADTGPNNLQNVPVLVGASANSISLNYSSNISATFRIEIFANDVADPSGYGEGQTFLGAGNVTTNASGNTGTVMITLPSPVPGGKFISATATDAAGNTSEFSANFTTIAPPVKINTTTTVTSSANPSSVGAAVTFTATVAPASGTTKPTGTVTFKDGATTLGTGTLNAQGVATFATAALSVGTHQITATYGGDAGFNASTSAVLTQTVNVGTSACSTVVTTNADSGNGSLRSAVDCANSNPDASTITFAASVRGTINLTTIGDTDATNGNLGDSALVLTAPVTITGPGANLLTAGRSAATGTADFRILRVAKGVTATISGLAMSNGNATAPTTFSRLGGGIYSDGKLTLASCTISGNVAGFSISVPSGHITQIGSGGGIYNTATATLTLSDCTVSNNNSTGGGVGIDNLGTATLSRCTLSGNKSPIEIAGFATGGGAINNDGANSRLTLSDCTLSGNVATFGGGIGNIGTATVTRCTLSGNSAGYGAGIENLGGITLADCTLSGNTSTGPLLSNSVNGGGGINNFGTATLVNCTIAGNSAVAYGGAISNVATLSLSNCTLSGNSSPNGGAIYSEIFSNGAASPVVTLSNTILNAGAQGANLVNKGSTITSKGYNLSSDNGGGFLTGTGDKINTNPGLGALANNGGPTQTLALLASSPALDMGNPGTTGLPANDQRGVGFPRVLNGRVDIGAVEGGVTPSVATSHTTITSSLNPSSVGMAVTFTAIVTSVSGMTPPTGIVTFTNFRNGEAQNATQIGAPVPLVNGVATVTTSTLPQGNNTVVAAYSGNGILNLSSAGLIQTVTAGPVLPTLSINDVALPEGNSGTNNFAFTVTLAPAASQTVTVKYATANGTAIAGSDYTSNAVTLTFAPGVATQTVSVSVIGDTVREADETFTVNLLGQTNAALGKATGTGTIQNDDFVADLSVTQTASVPSVPRSGTVVFTLTAKNNGPDNANNVTLTDVLPTGATLVSSVPAATTTSGKSLTYALGTIASGATKTIVLNVKAPATVGTLTNASTITQIGATDPVAANNGATVSVSVTNGAPVFALSVGKLINVGPYSPSLYRAGAHFVQDVTITNTGMVPANAPLSLVLDGLPSSVTVVGAGGIASNGKPFVNVPLSAGTLAIKQSVKVRVEFRLKGRDKPAFSPRVVNGTSAARK